MFYHKMQPIKTSTQTLNNLGMHQKVCNNSTKRNDCSTFFSKGVSGILHSFPHMVEDNVDSINLFLGGNAIQNVFLLVVNEVRSMCPFSVIETSKKNLGPDFVEIFHVLDTFCFIYI